MEERQEFIILILAFCACMCTAISSNPSKNSERQLVADILKNYVKADRVCRPVERTGEITDVHFGLSVVTIDDFDERTGELFLRFWITEKWKDYRLRWDEDKYAFKRTRMPVRHLWKPDIININSLDIKLMAHEDTIAIISSDGMVSWTYIARTHVRCYTKSPTPKGYPQWDCKFQFGSWAYDGFQLDLIFLDGLRSVNMAHWGGDIRFEFSGSSAKKNMMYYPCCEGPIPDLEFTMILRVKENPAQG